SPSRSSYFATSIPLDTGTTYSRLAFRFIFTADNGVGVVTRFALRIRRPMSYQDRCETMFLKNWGPGINGSKFSGIKWFVQTSRIRRLSAELIAASPII